MALYIGLDAIWQLASQLRRKAGENARSTVRRHKQPCLISDDLSEAALRLVPVKPRRRPTGEFKPLRAVDEAALERERLACLDLHRPSCSEDAIDNLLSRECSVVLKPQCLTELRYAVEGHLAAKQRASVTRRDPANPNIIGGELVPDRQQQASGKVQSFAFVAGGSLIDFRLPKAPELAWIDSLPAALRKLLGGEMAVLQRPDQFEAGNPRPIISQ